MSTAKTTKNRFIPVLEHLRQICAVRVLIDHLMAVMSFYVRNQPVSFSGRKHLLIESQLPELCQKEVYLSVVTGLE